MKTLIVEDDSTSRLILFEVLKPYGPVLTAVNGQEAVRLFNEAFDSAAPFDLVTLDIMMPLLDGQDTLLALRTREGLRPPVKVIMTTALDDPTNRSRAESARCDSYLVKPIRSSQLVAEIRRLGLVPQS